MPVSRKRKSKKAARKQRRGPVLPPLRSVPEAERTAWWPVRIAEVIDAADDLPAARGPRELEQAAAELIGGVLHRTLAEEKMGFALLGWLSALIDAAAETPTAPRWYLLHGIAAMAPGELAGQARDRIEGMRASGLTGPAWLAATPGVEPTGEVHLLRDAYGSRFGLAMTCRYPEPAEPDEHVYLLDVDACLMVADTVDASVHDDLAAACDEWRRSVGVAAASAVPEPVDAELLADLLPRSYSTEPGVIGGESRRRMDNYYRILRRGDDLARVLAAAGRPLPSQSRWARSFASGTHVELHLADFVDWLSTFGPVPPDQEAAAEELAEVWFDGSLEEARLSCSPHRIRGLQNRIAIEWPDDGTTAQVAALLPQWTRWCALRTGLDAELAARAVAAAERDRGEWESDDDALGVPVPE